MDFLAANWITFIIVSFVFMIIAVVAQVNNIKSMWEGNEEGFFRKLLIPFISMLIAAALGIFGVAGFIIMLVA